MADCKPDFSHLATGGVMASVRGTLMGSSAFVQRNARAREEPLLVRLLANHPLVCGSASSLTS